VIFQSKPYVSSIPPITSRTKYSSSDSYCSKFYMLLLVSEEQSTDLGWFGINLCMLCHH